MITNLYSIGTSALTNAQASVTTVSNNIANADTEGYRTQSTVYDSNSSIQYGSNYYGTGASITSIESEVDWYLEVQYYDSVSALSEENYLLDYLEQAESLFNQTEDSGLNAVLSDFFTAWSALASDPTSEAQRAEILGLAQQTIYELNSMANELDDILDDIESEIQDQVETANQLIEDIALLNGQINANPDDLELINERDLLVEQLSAILDITLVEEDNNQVSILTADGYPLVEGTETNEIYYLGPQSSYSSVSSSTWEGDVDFSGESSEEILIEFVSSGPDGTAQFKVSLDGGSTWETDEDGNVMLYTAGSSPDEAVEINGVEIWFDGTGDHAEGDRVTVMAKSGIYWSGDGGDTLKNITPMTDESGNSEDNRVDSGSLAGLFAARDDYLMALADDLDDLAEALIWEVNVIHSQGAGLLHQSTLVSTESVEDTTVPLGESDLAYADRMEAGEIAFTVYDADGNVASNASVSFDPATDSLEDLALNINAAFGGEITATVNADGTLTIDATGDYTFEIASDDTGALAALGINTFFTGSTASDIGLNAAIVSDPSHINAQIVEEDGTVSSGSNETAQAMADLASEDVQVGDDTDTIQGALSTMVSDIGTAVATAESRQTYASASVTYYANERESMSGVNVDEELTKLIKYQQSYEAAAQIITTAQNLFDIVMDMV
jgi:flagellar hook-associated protein 1 FlgK